MFNNQTLLKPRKQKIFPESVFRYVLMHLKPSSTLKNQIRTLYLTFIRPLVEFAVPVWSPILK